MGCISDARASFDARREGLQFHLIGPPIARDSPNRMNSEPDLLRIEVVDDEIVVSLPKSQLSVTYYRSG